MATFYNFLGQLERRGNEYGPAAISRMNWRYDHIVEPVKAELNGATILDLGSHDGRWSYAFAAAGATVTGIEGRANLIAKYARYPEAEWKHRVAFIEGDFLTEMDRLLAEGARFDAVMCLGVFYHTVQHYRMLMQMVAFRPKLIVIGGTFDMAKRPVIVINNEDTSVDRFTIASQPGQAASPIGRPSRSALHVMAESLNYTVEWRDWVVPESQRRPVKDYFEQSGNTRRLTCFLRPS